MGILNGDDGGHVHHHGLFAGLGAATAAVIGVLLLAALLARHAMATALGDAIWLIFAVLVAGAIGGIALWYRLIWHKHVQYSAAVAAPAVVRAEVISDVPAAVTAAAVPAIAPAAVHLHLPEGMDPGQVAVLLAGLRAGEHPELAPPE